MARYPEECETDPVKMRDAINIFENHPHDFLVTAFDGDTVIGDLGVTQIGNRLKTRHRASLGISVQKQYCNLGLGKIMIETAILQAEKNGFEQLELGVYADNARALHLYEKLGFCRCGVCPRAFLLKDGSYHDEVIMVRML